jgi:hypothetical protein
MHLSQGQKRSSLQRSVAMKRRVLRLLNRLGLIAPSSARTSGSSRCARGA